MVEMIVDTERLAINLEKGIGYVDKRFGAIGRAEKYRLRVPYCGLTSIATHEYFKSIGVPSEVLYGKINSGIGGEVEHCVNQVDLGENRWVIDCTYSQFLSLAGLTPGHATLIDEYVYPDTKIEVFKPDNVQNVVNRLAKCAINFQSHNSHPRSRFGIDMGEGPLTGVSYDAAQDVYSRIFDLSSYKPKADFNETTMKAGLVLSCFIGKKAIQFI